MFLTLFFVVFLVFFFFFRIFCLRLFVLTKGALCAQYFLLSSTIDSVFSKIVEAINAISFETDTS